MSASEERCPDCGLRLWRDGDEPGANTCTCLSQVEAAVTVAALSAGVVYLHGDVELPAVYVTRSLSVAERTKETVFTVRMRHPSDDDPTWTALVDGPDGAFDVGVAGNPDEALSQVIDTIALHDFGSDGDDDRYRP